MFVAILEVQPKKERWSDYLDFAKELKPKLEAIDGFIDNERFSSKRTIANAKSIRHRHARIVRDYGMFDRREGPQFIPMSRPLRARADSAGRGLTMLAPDRLWKSPARYASVGPGSFWKGAA